MQSPISIHALREEGDRPFPLRIYDYKISIHALREEGDALTLTYINAVLEFLSTPSARRATFFRLCWICSHRISIHALREEGDHRLTAALSGYRVFLSTPSARRATLFMLLKEGMIRFLSTPSARRATRLSFQGWKVTGISIHALREEGDRGGQESALAILNFYPRPPRGGRPGRRGQPDRQRQISIHALREEGDV